jgi:hypothetical protein
LHLLHRDAALEHAHEADRRAQEFLVSVAEGTLGSISSAFEMPGIAPGAELGRGSVDRRHFGQGSQSQVQTQRVVKRAHQLLGETAEQLADALGVH